GTRNGSGRRRLVHAAIWNGRGSVFTTTKRRGRSAGPFDGQIARVRASGETKCDDRARALADNRAPTRPCYSRKFADRRALGHDPQGARSGEEERWEECRVAFRDDR